MPKKKMIKKTKSKKGGALRLAGVRGKGALFLAGSGKMKVPSKAPWLAPWINHVNIVKDANPNMKYKDILKLAKQSYKK